MTTPIVKIKTQRMTVDKIIFDRTYTQGFIAEITVYALEQPFYFSVPVMRPTGVSMGEQSYGLQTEVKDYTATVSLNAFDCVGLIDGEIKALLNQFLI